MRVCVGDSDSHLYVNVGDNNACVSAWATTTPVCQRGRQQRPCVCVGDNNARVSAWATSSRVSTWVTTTATSSGVSVWMTATPSCINVVDSDVLVSTWATATLVYMYRRERQRHPPINQHGQLNSRVSVGDTVTSIGSRYVRPLFQPFLGCRHVMSLYFSHLRRRQCLMFNPCSAAVVLTAVLWNVASAM